MSGLCVIAIAGSSPSTCERALATSCRPSQKSPMPTSQNPPAPRAMRTARSSRTGIPARLERARDARAVQPPVVVAAHGEDAERRLDRAQPIGDRFGRDEPAAYDPLDHEVAEQQHEVRSCGIDLGHDTIELLNAGTRRSDVEIRRKRHAQRPTVQQGSVIGTSRTTSRRGSRMKAWNPHHSTTAAMHPSTISRRRLRDSFMSAATAAPPG